MNEPVRHPPVEAGKRYGRLVAQHETDRDARGRGYRQWVVECDCGTVKVVRDDALRSGNVLSCGCSRYETSIEVVLSVRDAATLRALSVLEGWDPDDAAGALVGLVRDAGRRRALHHIVDQRDPEAAQSAVRSLVRLRASAKAGADARRRKRPSKAERAAFRAGEIEAG